MFSIVIPTVRPNEASALAIEHLVKVNFRNRLGEKRNWRIIKIGTWLEYSKLKRGEKKSRQENNVHGENEDVHVPSVIEQSSKQGSTSERNDPRFPQSRIWKKRFRFVSLTIVLFRWSIGTPIVSNWILI